MVDLYNPSKNASIIVGCTIPMLKLTLNHGKTKQTVGDFVEDSLSLFGSDV